MATIAHSDPFWIPKDILAGMSQLPGSFGPCYEALKDTWNDPGTKEAWKKTVIYGEGVIVVVVGGVAYGVAAAEYGATTVASMAEEEVIKYIYANPLKVKLVYDLVDYVLLNPPTKTIPGQYTIGL